MKMYLWGIWDWPKAATNTKLGCFSNGHILCGMGVDETRVKAVPPPGKLGKYFQSKITMSFIYLFNKLFLRVSYGKELLITRSCKYKSKHRDTHRHTHKI